MKAEQNFAISPDQHVFSGSVLAVKCLQVLESFYKPVLDALKFLQRTSKFVRTHNNWFPIGRNVAVLAVKVPKPCLVAWDAHWFHRYTIRVLVRWAEIIQGSAVKKKTTGQSFWSRAMQFCWRLLSLRTHQRQLNAHKQLYLRTYR